MTTNSEEYRIRRIPDNFENGINFAGFNFKPIFLIEGIVLGIIFFALAIVIMFACGIRHINSLTPSPIYNITTDYIDEIV